jgi:hypothetical protein
MFGSSSSTRLPGGKIVASNMNGMSRPQNQSTGADLDRLSRYRFRELDFSDQRASIGDMERNCRRRHRQRSCVDALEKEAANTVANVWANVTDMSLFQLCGMVSLRTFCPGTGS